MKTLTKRAIKAEKLRKKAELLSVSSTGLKADAAYKAAAKLGDEESQVILGYAYAYGNIYPYKWNKAEAIRWFKRAYKQGSWDAAFNMGMLYRDDKDWKRALSWFERAYKLGDTDALFEIAKVHLRYGGDLDTGIRYIKKALASKKLTRPVQLEADKILKEHNAHSKGYLLYMKAEVLDSQKRYVEALPLLQRGAKLGDYFCQNLLAGYLSEGKKGIPADREKAIYWYKQIIKQGIDLGATNLAVTYRRIGNVNESFLWFEQAVKLGDASANLELAKIWLYARGNEAKAIEHLNAVISGSTSEMDRDAARSLLRRLSMKSKNN